MIRLLLAVLLFWATGSLADEIRPGYLSISEQGDLQYQVVLKLPMKGDRVLDLYPEYPADCTSELRHNLRDGRATTQYWQMNCQQPLQGRKISIPNLAVSSTDIYLHFQANQSENHYRLTPAKPNQILASNRGNVWSTYVLLGTEHILLGWDHLCFVLLLILVASSLRQLLYAVTGFTLAHSVTLAASTLGWVSLPGNSIEILIAASIVFLARELMVAKSSEKAGVTIQHPVLMTALFGLLHGFGFASVLSDIGFPQQQIAPALLSFNVGVELGQLLFIAVVLSGMKLLEPVKSKRYVVTSLCTVTGAVGCYWVLERSLVLLQ